MKRAGLTALLTLGLVAGFAAAGSAHAQVADADKTPDAVAAPSGDAQLDRLFSRLKRESDPRNAKLIADDIWTQWTQSGSATIDLLMQWSNEAMRDNRFATALDLLDQVIVLRPDYAEGWNRRATVHFLMNEHAKSMADINKVLALEPRHFGALSGMAAIFTAAGRDAAALRAYRRVLDVYPADRGAQEKVIELEDELAGDPV